MSYDDWKSTPVDERTATRSRPSVVRQCAGCGSTVSPQFVPIGEDYLCQACFRESQTQQTQGAA